jgi:hypothetical protein
MGRPAIMPGKPAGAPARPQPALVAKEGKR